MRAKHRLAVAKRFLLDRILFTKQASPVEIGFEQECEVVA
jgi:hypothetical protein